MSKNKYTFRKILVVSVWTLLLTGTVVLLIAAISKKSSSHISGVQIVISGVQNNYFIDKKDVLNILEKVNGKKLKEQPIGSLDLTKNGKESSKRSMDKKGGIIF